MGFTRSYKTAVFLHLYFIFTAMHGMQTWSSDEKAVRVSVRLSDKRVNCDNTEERSVQIFYTI